jgi:hypothetical protein
VELELLFPMCLQDAYKENFTPEDKDADSLAQLVCAKSYSSDIAVFERFRPPTFAYFFMHTKVAYKYNE